MCAGWARVGFEKMSSGLPLLCPLHARPPILINSPSRDSMTVNQRSRISHITMTTDLPSVYPSLEWSTIRHAHAKRPYHNRYRTASADYPTSAPRESIQIRPRYSSNSHNPIHIPPTHRPQPTQPSGLPTSLQNGLPSYSARYARSARRRSGCCCGGRML